MVVDVGTARGGSLVLVVGMLGLEESLRKMVIFGLCLKAIILV